MKNMHCVIYIMLALSFGIRFTHCQQSTIQPSEDVYVITFGGGEGCNPFLKYDITAVPAGMDIDSVFLIPSVWQINTNWDGDANFWNVNSQTWTEADSSRLIYSIPTSNQVAQAAGFCMTMGPNRSADLSDIFLADYNASNTYCSIKIKDQDDVTFQPAPGSYPVNSNDTLALGNRVFNQHVFFYPSEYANAPPWLVIFYHNPGAADEKGVQGTDGQRIILTPNPFSDKLTISCDPGRIFKDAVCKIYDAEGRLVRSLFFGRSVPRCMWNGNDDAGQELPSGTYFVEINDGKSKYIRNIILIK